MSSGALKISEDHVWVQPQDGEARVGISDFAAEALGTIIYVELPEVGNEVTRGEPFAAVESGKASVELTAPISGRVTEVNEELEDTPDLINQDTFAKGWIAVLSVKDGSELDELMTKAEYDMFIAVGEEH
ncbi:MAG: glycine cleavage system protein GcvH [Deltaproteobacteria bacterium]|nr:MAG: glycine cleavage system protein GcvH [Deltaproteobacteria bacterium]